MSSSDASTKWWKRRGEQVRRPAKRIPNPFDSVLADELWPADVVTTVFRDRTGAEPMRQLANRHKR